MPTEHARWMPLALVGLVMALAGCPSETEPLVTRGLEATPEPTSSPAQSASTRPTGNLLELLPSAPAPTPTPTLAPLRPPISVSASPASPAPTPSSEEEGWPGP